MVLVMIWSAVLLMLSAVLAQATINLIKPSDRSEKSFAALAAAEAGLDDYRARLTADNRYFLRTDNSNASLTGWAPVPGGDGAGEFTVAVDATRALKAGELRIISTGRVGDVTRTAEALLTKRSTLDYVYISDYETTAPGLPGAYSDTTTAITLCTLRYWKDAGAVSKAGVSPATGAHRNSQFCRWAGIYNSERFKGRVHTNDVWYLAHDLANVDPLNVPASNTTATFNGAVTTSCPAPSGSLAGCPTNHRWIDVGTLSGGSVVYSNNAGTWTTSTVFKSAEIPNPATSYTNMAWNPTWDSRLEIPASNSLLKQYAELNGCVFTGPTRIRLRPDFTLEITSPDTKSTTTMCGGTTLASTTAAPSTQPTFIMDLAAAVRAGFNGVIYVENVTGLAAADPNYWTTATAPSCQKKVTGAATSYPFVIPSREATDVFNASYTTPAYANPRKGFPSQLFGSTSTWYDCMSGDLFVQGEYTGALTIATDNNVALTGDLVDHDVVNKTVPNNTTYGAPPLTSDNMLGLVPSNFLYVYRPLWDDPSTSGTTLTSTPDWNYAKTNDIILDMATVVLGQCFGAQDATLGPGQGGIYMFGSLGQRYRCPVGTSGGATGYAKHYSHDDRYAVEDPPPYMLELSIEPWKVKAYSETTIRRDPVAQVGLVKDTGSQGINTTRTYDVQANDTSGSTLESVAIRAGYGNVSIVNGRVSYTSSNYYGDTIIEYVVRRPDGYRAAQTLTVTVQ